jgi:hypothetical protein
MLIILAFCGFVHQLQAQWLLNFGTAATVASKDFAFISGTGGQVTFIKNPATNNFTPFLAHAGLRLGISRNVDIGYRLGTVTMPWSSVDPTLGSAFDAKIRLTPTTAPYQVAVIVGGGYAYLTILDNHKSAWSPGIAESVTRQLNVNSSITFNGRLLQTIIPTALGRKANNYVNIWGGSIGWAHNLNSVVGIIPELGIFDVIGQINHVANNGIGLQVGLALKVDFKKSQSMQ